MKVKVLKGFAIDGEYKAGDIIDISEEDFQFLLSSGLVGPVKQKELFEQAFKEHFERLKKIPITISTIKEQYPEVYKKLRELEKLADDAFLSFDYDRFVNTLKQIEEIMSSINKQKAEYKNPVTLDRKCVNCGSDSWLKAKPEGKTLITCAVCGHSELHVP